MSEFDIRFVKTGMVLNKDAYSPGGTQLIMPKGTVLDDTRIARLAFYGIKKVDAELPGFIDGESRENEAAQDKNKRSEEHTSELQSR